VLSNFVFANCILAVYALPRFQLEVSGLPMLLGKTGEFPHSPASHIHLHFLSYKGTLPFCFLAGDADIYPGQKLVPGTFRAGVTVSLAPSSLICFVLWTKST
jgi:hypothetical protein